MAETRDAKIYERLDAIFEIVNQIKISNERRDVTISALAETAKENKESIKGNGKTGLETKVTLLEKQMNTVNWIGALLFVAILGDVMTRILK